MKYKYRGQLNNKKMVDIFNFDGELAKCDHGAGEIHIDEFNCIFFPRDTFKKDVLGMDVDKVEIKEEIKPFKKKSK